MDPQYTRLQRATCLAGGLWLSLLSCSTGPAHESGTRAAIQAPNVVLIFTDDQGYGDLSCYGHPTIHTPHIDRLAREGAKLTQFYVASPVCSPSRAALLTGCYPKRVGMHEHVVFPEYDYGLHTDEVTLADLLGEHGYATGIFGKWHLGHRPGLLPLDQGFDTWLGVPYSNDMAQFHRKEDTTYKYRLPLMRDREVIEWEPDQHLLTRRFTEAAVDFIEEHAEQPFLVYLPHSMPHIPLYASEEFEGSSPRGLYGDVIEEIDWSVGEVLATLDRLELSDRTLVIFTSDNGPWLEFKADGGSAGPLRGGKGTNWEGGQRVPCVLRYPPLVEAGSVRREMMSTMDVLPTVAALVGAELPQGRVIDGEDVRELWRADVDEARSERSFLFYSKNGPLVGIRRGPWKLLLESGELYDVEEDISETRNRAEKHPELVEELRAEALALDARIEAEQRPVRTVEELLFHPERP
jgi:arylsulfatase A